MKSTLTILMALFFASSSLAQLDPQANTFTFDPGSGTAYDANCFRLYNNTQVTLDFYLFNPVNPDFGTGAERTVTNVSGFECKVTGTEGINILGWSFPVPYLNFGDSGELIVGYSEPVPVVGGAVKLASVDLFVGNITSFTLPAAPAGRCVNEDNAALEIGLANVQSIAGFTAYVDADDPVDPLVAGQVMSLQIAIYEEQPVATDSQTWGTLKALYR